ncbi:MAG: polysaccharide biosynthesis tyrosine autokinase [Alphaproteobacteria bacterium]|nr:polysaccharide biosynthesis tyrosine autokinase [Alphaproteobacteria bacterium]
MDASNNLLERSYEKSRISEATIQTEADIMASSSLATRVIEKLKLTEDPEFNIALRPVSPWAEFFAQFNPLPFITGQKAGEEMLSEEGKARVAMTRIQGQFLSKLGVKSRRRSFVVTLTFTASNGEKAAWIVNTLADLYVVDRLEASYEENRRVSQWLEQRLEGLRRDVTANEQAAEEFRVTHNLAVRRKGERQFTIADQQLTELNSRLVLARSELAQKQARMEQVRALSRGRGSIETAYDVLQSSLIQRLREQEAIKQRELSEAMKTYGERHPRIIGQRADLEELRDKIGQEIEKVGAALASEVEASRVGVSTLEREIAKIKASVDTAGHHEVELREFERQAETSRLLYESLLSRYKEDMEQERIQRANARVLSQASIPVQPSSPRRLRILAAALALSSLTGAGLVFLLDRLNGRIRTAEEAEQLTGLPILATIPRWMPRGKETGDAAHVLLDDPRSVLTNAFRSLRTVLGATVGEGKDKVILVASSVPQEGKSFVVRNLALTMAAGGSKVLLVDADLMRPTQHVALQLSPEAGLTQLLTSPGLSPFALIRRDERGGIDVLPAGPLEANSAHALATGRLREVIEAVIPYYHHILIDGPPILAATDTQILSGLADQIVFVVKWNSTLRDAVLTSLKYLTKVGARVSGLVLSQALSRVDPAASYGGYGYYGAYKGYGG